MSVIECLKSLPVKAVVATLVVIAIFAGCGGDKATEPFKDGPRSDVVNNDESDILRFPDGFSNVATKCDHGNRVYVLYKGDNSYGAVAVSPADVSCPQIGTAATVEP